MIYKYEGSFGSKLHKDQSNNYVAYALWPDRTTWENAGSNLPKKAKEFSTMMRDSCIKIETKYELEEIEDLIKSKTSN